MLGHYNSLSGPAAATPASADLPLRPRAWPNPQLDLVLRIVVLQVLCLIAYGDVYYTLAVSISEGSRAAYLMVVPIHLVIIAFGRGTVAKGVSDGETDWILAIALGGLALLISYLTANRFPTTSGLWNLPLISSMLWGICAATILFGVRRVWQVWPLWLFSLLVVTPLPSMFITARLGGSNFAAASVAAILGAVAVFLGGERSPMRWRLLATAGCAALGVGASAVLATRPLPVSVSVGAGAVPLICFILLYRFSAVSSRTTDVGGGLAGDEGSGKFTPEAHSAAGLPLRSPITLTMLVALTGILLVINTAIAGKQKMELARAQADWISQAGLSASQEFDFIHRYLGTDANFTRYLPAQVAGYPAAAVDVITVASLGALRSYRDVIWYPAPVLPNYATIALTDTVNDVQVLATDSSAATSGAVQDWYALTWSWNIGSGYQQVFVVVNQHTDPADPPPPDPAPPSVLNTIIAPALWLSRQQANPSTVVDPVVAARAQQVAGDILAAAAARRD